MHYMYELHKRTINNKAKRYAFIALTLQPNIDVQFHMDLGNVQSQMHLSSKIFTG